MKRDSPLHRPAESARAAPAAARLVRWERGLGGLRRQLMLFTAGAMFATLALLATFTLHEQTALARTGLEQQAAAVARSIALGSETPMLDDRLDMVEELALRAAAFPGVSGVWVLDAQGRVLTQVQAQAPSAMNSEGQPGEQSKRQPQGPALRTPYAGDEAPQAVPAEARPRIESGEGLIVAWHPMEAGRLLGWVRVHHSTATLQDIGRRILVNTVAVCALALFGSLLMLRALLRRPLDALDQARDFAARLGRAAGEQMPDPGGARETSQLVQALNGLSGQLQRQHLDIREAFQRLQGQEAQLADRNEQLATLFALSPDGLVSMDRDGTIRFANPAFAGLIGLEAQALVGRDEAWLEARLRECSVQAANVPSLSRVIEEGGGQAHPLALALPRALQVRLTGVRGHSAAASRLLFARDVTHESEIERLKDEFIATAAHELRTPMASIHGFAELMMNFPMAPEKQAQLLAKVYRHSSAMIQIVNDLLDLSRLDARGSSDFEPVALDLGALVRDTVGDLAVPEGRAAPMLREGVRQAWPVHADPGRLAQVLRNLLTNAYKYSPGGGDVEIGLRRQGGEVVLEVRDHGIGMTPEQLSRVCERFYRADTSGAIAGTGLGMSIVKELVQLHGGRLAIDSMPGQGTTVGVWLKCLDASAIAPGAPAPQGAEQGLASPDEAAVA